MRRASTALIKEDPDSGLAVMDYSEFLATFPNPADDARLAPLAMILKRAGLSMADNPVFWTRVVGYAYMCQQFIATHGTDMGFTDRTLDVKTLVAFANDMEIQKHSSQQEEIFIGIVAEGL